ncbi:unnamed protein product [Vitrella brassicaformis CCMP3155]|uniref:Dynein light chain n=1 Tax=Vitrella brassicaformis (strain CCMP3155) TaxID=1169540 RepID=A0A0G4FDJ6_VITBC|nr:unnamed protein product [Vitrella brassicaformis CCMP3155]|mmetsp:Transcript_12387/g.29605  ORF Transcript_12387/g.29605 Transcript_12387/m.29605 type:complete len:104 (-) Transcript_12387:108-419(-)|eukprot:CEM10982.1 unnamed protein product [Vitrella brassicaformis CCMP3155]
MSAAAPPKDPEVPLAVTKEVHMHAEEIDFAIAAAKKSFQSLIRNDIRLWQEVAEAIKKEFDAHYKGTWHVIVGQHFGAFVTHETHHMICFKMGGVNFLIFRHG